MRALAFIAALALAGCAGRGGLAPMPPLPAAIAQDCPVAAPLPDTTVAALAQADADLAILYAKCRANHRAAVDAYNAARGAREKKK